jgi:hypothetical protein
MLSIIIPLVPPAETKPSAGAAPEDSVLLTFQE